jgi:AmmeMemoRadiSam system radical SAM enzyme
MWKLDIEDVATLEHSEGRRLAKYTPEQMVSEARRNGCLSIASTYNEPTVTSEFSYQVFKLAKSKGLFTVYVTNGFESVETLNLLGGVLDAVNIDLKSFREPFYSAICGAHLQGVCDTIRRTVAMGIHTEVTTLIIPSENDSDAELRDVATFLASVDPEIVWHISAYHDDYKFEGRGRTPIATLERAAAIGRSAGLRYVYMGNVRAYEGGTTKCPKCGRVLIERDWGGRIRMERGRCSCGEVIPGLFKDASNLRPRLETVPPELAGDAGAEPVGAVDVSDAVIFAGMNGTSKHFAEEAGGALGFPVLDLGSVAAPRVLRLRRVVFCVSTYGRGTPPRNAAEAWAGIAALAGQAAPGAEFAVLGCGSLSFGVTFCGFAKAVQQKMLALGFKEVAPIFLRDELDKGSGGRASQWIAQLKFT